VAASAGAAALVCALVAVVLAVYLTSCADLAARFVEPDHRTSGYPVTVLATTTTGLGSWVTLDVSPDVSRDTARPGVCFLSWATGSATLGPVPRVLPDRVQRRVVAGAVPPVGTHAAVSWSYSGDPGSALGLATRTLRYRPNSARHRPGTSPHPPARTPPG
jgi:hypothetical protein